MSVIILPRTIANMMSTGSTPTKKDAVMVVVRLSCGVVYVKRIRYVRTANTGALNMRVIPFARNICCRSNTEHVKTDAL